MGVIRTVKNVNLSYGLGWVEMLLFPIIFYHINLHVKFHLWIPKILGSSSHLKVHLPPYKVENNFVTNPRTIYIIRSTVKFVTQKKKLYQKYSFWPDLWPKNCLKWPHFWKGPFCMFFSSINQAKMNIFENAFFSWVKNFTVLLLVYMVPGFVMNFFQPYKGQVKFQVSGAT